MDPAHYSDPYYASPYAIYGIQAPSSTQGLGLHPLNSATLGPKPIKSRYFYKGDFDTRARGFLFRHQILIKSLILLLLLALSLVLVLRFAFSALNSSSASDQMQQDQWLLQNNNNLNPSSNAETAASQYARFNPNAWSPAQMKQQQQQQQQQQSRSGIKCDLGYWGNQCQFGGPPAPSDTYQQANKLLAQCLLTNCNNNGQCTHSGHCHCFPGFMGSQCQFRMPSQVIPTNQMHQQQARAGQPTAPTKCDPGYWGDQCQFGGSTAPLTPGDNSPSDTYQPNNKLLAQCLLTNCHGNGQCNHLGQCHCFAGFMGPNCQFRMPTPVLATSQNPSSQQQSTPSQQVDSSSASSSLKSLFITPTQVVIAPLQANCPPRLNNCNQRGLCQANRCKCSPGFRGETCQERDLCHLRPVACANGAACRPETGECLCPLGSRGANCELRDETEWARLVNCSRRGQFDFVTSRCKCDSGFAGADCSEEKCDSQLNCGPNGRFDCKLNKCVCQDGYSGDLCSQAQCSPQCLRNGQCVEGLCVCSPGFYGRHCSLNGCPNNCSNRGECVRTSGADSTPSYANPTSSQQQPPVAEWRCQCQAGASGPDCSSLIEQQCDDGIDNDRDGLVDCADSECCGDKVCQNSTLCMKSPDPLDILMRKQPSPPTASFFQRMQFLIEKFSSQIYSNPKDFNDSLMTSLIADRASVIRGRVTYMRQGVTGVRVSVAGQTNLGSTLTRDGGHFDLMVNGGGALVIEFRREPFATHRKAVLVPWNEIVLMDAIDLSLDSLESGATPADQPTLNELESSQQQQQPSCSAHNYKLMRPQIVAAPRSTRKTQHPSQQNSMAATRPSGGKMIQANNQQQTSRAVILRNSQTVQQTIVLPGSSSQTATSSSQQQSVAGGESSNESVSLVYISSRANEFMSTISLQLTPVTSEGFAAAANQIKLPEELKLIHLKIIIEGILFEQVFEPQSNLSFTYAWNRRNVYRQKSFGLSTARVSVGYEYHDCKHVIWSSKHIQLPGHDLSISDIGSQWNLNIHHRYNYRDAILQRGDGQNFNLKTDKPRVVQQVMGDGYQRQLICPYCDSQASTNPIEQRLYKPQALVSAPDGSLYVGDHNLVRRIEPRGAPSGGGSSRGSPGERSVRTVVELPNGRAPSRYGLALDLVDSRLYLSDPDKRQVFLVRETKDSLPTSGANSTDGSTGSDEILIPVVGSGIKCQLDDGTNCGDGQAARLARLVEPKAIAFDLANRMYLADGPNIRMVDLDGKIYTILGDYGSSMAATSAGGSHHQHQRRRHQFPCQADAIPMHLFSPKSPLDLALNPLDEALHFLDDNVVYKITQDKRIQIVAGRPAHCLAELSSNKLPTTEQNKLRASQVYLQSAQSIAFNQNGELFIAEDDQKLISRILLVSPEEDSITLYAGQPLEQPQQVRHSLGGANVLLPTVDSLHLVEQVDLASPAKQVAADASRSSNMLPLSQTTKAIDYKFNSISAIAVDQQGNLMVADKIQLRIMSLEADLPQVNAAGEYELQSPDNSDELLVFNRYGHHVATRELTSTSAQSQRNPNKYTFAYSVNTSFGQLASVSYSTGNKISIYRDGPHHSVKMIETAFGGQCKLDVSRSGQVHSITTIAANTTRTNFAYHVDGGLLKQSRDQASGESFDFSYDEFGRATGIQHATPRSAQPPIECRLDARQHYATSAYCANLIVAE